VQRFSFRTGPLKRFAPRPRRVLRSLVLAAVVMPLACTFPDVDYSDTSADEFASACFVPAACEPEVTACSKQAANQHGACLNKCGPPASQACAACETEYDSALNVCLAQCESCSAENGCKNATQSCKGWLSIP